MKQLFIQSNVTNLSTQIKTFIGYRISLCFILALSSLLTITIIEIHSSTHQLEKSIQAKCKSLESFIVSQYLVRNEDAIQAKLDSFNQKYLHTHFTFSSGVNNTPQRLFWHLPGSWSYFYVLKNLDGSKLGTLNVTGSILFQKNSLFSQFIEKISLLILFYLLIFIVLYPLSRRIPQQLFIAPINNLLTLLRNEENDLTNNLPNIPIEINEIKLKIKNLLKDVEKSSRDTALGEIAMQVAHDIRSPLMALHFETEDLFLIPEKKRIDIRNAIQRVNDIANNLLSQYKQNRAFDYLDNSFSSEPVAIMLESIISEKRIQLCNSSIQISLDKCSEADLFFIKVDIAGFKRVLSNIINNSIESIDANGIITVKVNTHSGKVIISVTDNGCGIPKNQLPLIVESGVSYGKKHGSGLGLPYVIKKIESWCGKYTISSETNRGTIFEITLPRARMATWFASNIHIPKNWSIVLLDDDKLIHSIWSEKLTTEFILRNNLNLIHFYKAAELEDYCRNHGISRTLFLLDYELRDNNENGLVLAERLNITTNTILVTNLHEDPDIKRHLLRLKMKMLPKSLVHSMAIRIIEDIDFIFIDDDVSITEIWNVRANSSGKKIETFNDIHEFMDIFNLYNKETLIFIDSELGIDLKGEDFAKILYDNGYQNLILCTGHDEKRFDSIYWVKRILDKYPPF